MHILRKITTVGKSRGISLPKAWLDWLEREYGEKPREVILKIDHEIRIIPIVKKEAGKREEAHG